MGKVLTLTEWSYIFLFWLLTTLGFYLVEVAERGIVGLVCALTGWGDGLRRMAGGAWRGGKICRKAAERIDSIHKMHHT